MEQDQNERGEESESDYDSEEDEQFLRSYHRDAYTDSNDSDSDDSYGLPADPDEFAMHEKYWDDLQAAREMPDYRPTGTPLED